MARHAGTSSAARGRVDFWAVMLAALGAGMVTSGIQGIAPAIPAMQEALGLSEAQVSLITSIYLLPSIVVSLPAGLLADRMGVRRVFAAALGLFGLGGAVLLVAHDLWVLLLVRAVQGAAFGAVLSLSITIIATVAPSGPVAAKSHSRRVVAMSGGETIFPVVAGALVTLSWFAPFAIQLAALPIALASWWVLPDVEGDAKHTSNVRSNLGTVMRSRGIVGVQVLGALRFFFKFALVTYYPILAVNKLGMSPLLIGVTLGAASLLAVFTAMATSKLARRFTSSQLLGGCLATIAVSLTAVALVAHPAVVLVAVLLYGLQDGVYAVSHNVLVGELAPAVVRSTYVGITSTTRNVGKFVAPLVFGAVTLGLSIPQTFLVFAAMGALSVELARRVTRLQRDS